MAETTSGIAAGDRDSITADLVVVGSGAAGLAGAFFAALDGASVVLIEKSDVIGGTTALSGGGMWIPCNDHMGEVGVEDSREEALEYLRACVGDTDEEERLVALVDNSAEMARLLEAEGRIPLRPWPAIGGTIDYRPWHPGAKPGGRALMPGPFEVAELGEWGPRVRTGPMSRWTVDPLDYYAQRMHLQHPDPSFVPRTGELEQTPIEKFSSGAALVAYLLRACLEQGVDVMTGTAATELIAEDGRVTGVRARHDGADIRLSARGGVLMASGGFANNEELKRIWFSRPLEKSADVESNQGDGQLMGAAIGAQLAGLGDAWWMPHVEIGAANDVVNTAGSREDRILPHTVIVNRSGRRFMNEAVNYYDAGEAFGFKVGATPRNFPAWFLFDQQGVERYALLSWKVPQGETPAWLRVAETIEDLAAAIEVPAGELRKTIETFNEFARNGVDEEFGRGANEWDLAWGDPEHQPNPCLGTLEKGPFYAVPIHAGALATRGGLRIDAAGRVLAVSGEPIAGLFAAGNCSNGAAAGCYPGPGATIGAAMTFAYIAGKSVAAGA